VADSSGPKNHVLDGGPKNPRGMGNFGRNFPAHSKTGSLAAVTGVRWWWRGVVVASLV